MIMVLIWASNLRFRLTHIPLGGSEAGAEAGVIDLGIRQIHIHEAGNLYRHTGTTTTQFNITFTDYLHNYFHLNSSAVVTF